MLAQIDSFNVFPRSKEEGVPFLLVDGHHSRTRLPFLEYITDKAHEYGTHIWQSHDSSKSNGTFKMKLHIEKLKYLKSKHHGSNYNFNTTNVIPIVNRTWADTIGDK
jgi:hypothetical protein